MSEYTQDSGPILKRDDSSVWMISFGDLLTLLVCFFVILTPRLSKEISSVDSIQEFTGNSGGINQFGTSLASSQEGVSGRDSAQVALLTAESDLVSHELVEAWTDFESRNGDAAVEIKVTICNEVLLTQIASVVYAKFGERQPQIKRRLFEVAEGCKASLGNSKVGAPPVALVEFRRI